MSSKEKIKRAFILGDEWLYYKIYTGINISDDILTEIIKPTAKELLKKEIIDSWFFIRYSDSAGHHLRIRFHFTKNSSLLKIINYLSPHFDFYLKEGLIWGIQTDIYHREIKRYGINSMLLSEKIFYQHSDMLINLLSFFKGAEGEDLRWLFALVSIDSFLEKFEFSIKDKIDFLENLNNRFRKELSVDQNKITRKQINDKYREEKEKINKIFEHKFFLTNDEFRKILDLYEYNVENIVSEILLLNNERKLNMTLTVFIESHLHMQLNRLFKSKNQLHEMMCYDFLLRYHKSVAARKILN